jgi:hypothetical protein
MATTSDTRVDQRGTAGDHETGAAPTMAREPRNNLILRDFHDRGSTTTPNKG